LCWAAARRSRLPRSRPARLWPTITLAEPAVLQTITALTGAFLLASEDAAALIVGTVLIPRISRTGLPATISPVPHWCSDHERSVGSAGRDAGRHRTDGCHGRCCLPIRAMCWSCDRIANAVTRTSTWHPRTYSSARTSAPGAATARRTSCAASARTVRRRTGPAPHPPGPLARSRPAVDQAGSPAGLRPAAAR